MVCSRIESAVTNIIFAHLASSPVKNWSKAHYEFVIHAQIIMVFHGVQEAAGSNSAIPIY